MTNRELVETLQQVTQRTNMDELPCYENINFKQDRNTYMELHNKMGHAPSRLLKQWVKVKNMKLGFQNIDELS